MEHLSGQPAWAQMLATALMAVGAAALWLIARWKDWFKKSDSTPPATILGASLLTTDQIERMTTKLAHVETAVVRVETATERNTHAVDRVEAAVDRVCDRLDRLKD